MLQIVGHLSLSGTPPSRRTQFDTLVSMRTPKAVVFDIDGTLSPEVSWLALTRDLGAPVDQHVQIYNDYKEGLIDYPTSKAQLIGLWRATGNANKEFLVIYLTHYRLTLPPIEWFG